MIQKTHAPYPLRELREGRCIAAIGIAARLIRDIGSLGTADYLSIFPAYVLSPLESTYLCQTEPISGYRLLMYIERRLLFANHEAEGIHPVVEREGEKFHMSVLVNELRLAHLQLTVIDIELYSVTEMRQEEIQNGLE